MPAPVVHFEILGEDPKKLQKFYKSVFDWSIMTNNPINYALIEPAGDRGIGGGIMAPREGEGSYITVYIEVDDLQAYLDKIEQAGGVTTVPVTEIPGMVTFAMFEDPEGNRVGLLKSE